MADLVLSPAPVATLAPSSERLKPLWVAFEQGHHTQVRKAALAVVADPTASEPEKAEARDLVVRTNADPGALGAAGVMTLIFACITAALAALGKLP